MKYFMGFGLLIIILVVGCNDDPKFSSSETGVAGDGNLHAILDQIKTDFKVPALGAMMLVGDSILEAEAAGERAFGFGVMVTDNDQWHIGAITKAMTATLAAILVEEGLINWETTAGEIFSTSLIRREFADVRLEEFFYHTSGTINDITRIPSWGGDRENIEDIISLRKQWALELLNFEPEVVRGVFNYSNGGYIIAGAMLEAVTDWSWEDLITERLFAPLGMKNSGFGSPGTGGKHLQPYGHFKGGDLWIPVEPGPLADNPPPLGPAGTIHSTLQDFALYLKMHKDGANGISDFLKPESFQKLHTPFPGSNYAMGWQTGEVGGNKILAHNGSNTLWFAEVRVEPDRDYVIMIVTNSGNTGGQDAIIKGIQTMTSRFDKLDQ